MRDPHSRKAALQVAQDTHLPEDANVDVHCGIGSALSPVHFRGPKSWRVCCYALLRG